MIFESSKASGSHDDLAALLRDMSEILQQQGGDVDAKLKQVKELIDSGLNNAKGPTSGLVCRSKELACAADTCVRESPWQAVGGAFVAGLVIGVLVCRR
jgi:Uncharacterized conserved protein